MTPLPSNNTAVLRVQYNSGTAVHIAQFREIPGANRPNFVTAVRDFCTALVSRLPTAGGFTNATIQESGSNISTPLIWAAINGTNGAALPATARPSFVTFSGRTTLGRRVRIFVYDPYVVPESDFRLELADVVAYQNARTVLVNASGLIGGIDGNPVSWYSTFNVGYNAYWTRRSRRLG